jgi:hypothetical protein
MISYESSLSSIKSPNVEKLKELFLTNNESEITPEILATYLSKFMDISKMHSKYCYCRESIQSACTNCPRYFVIPKNNPFVSYCTLKIVFNIPPGTRLPLNILDLVVDAIIQEVGNVQHSSMGMVVNNSLAKSLGLWPKYSNTVPNVTNDTIYWVATIPIITSEVLYKECVFPIKAVEWHDMIYKFYTSSKYSQFIHDMYMDVEYVMLDTNTEKQLTDMCKGKMPLDLPKDIPSLEFVHKQDITSLYAYHETKKLLGETYTMYEITYIIREKCSCILVDINISQIENCKRWIIPFYYLSIFYDSNEIIKGDYADVTEYYWLRCGLKSPNKPQTRPGQYSCILPFDLNIFKAKTPNPTTYMTLPRTSDAKVVLYIKLNPQYAHGHELDVRVHSASMATRKYISGLCGL